MRDVNDQAMIVLEQSARALARWVVLRHGELDESLPERFGACWQQSWLQDVEIRLRLLGQAIALECPSLFVDGVRWAGLSNAARDLDPGDLRTSLRVTREVLAEELTAGIAERATSVIEAAEAVVETDPTVPATGIPDTSRHRDLALRFVEAALEGRMADARHLVLDARRSGLDPVEIYEEVLRPAQVEVGRLWHMNEVSITDERLVTATTQDVMSLLRSDVPAPCVDAPAVLTVAIGGDLHEIGVRMVADLFLFAGWRSLCLGANVPAEDIVHSVARYEPDVLAISIASPLRLCAVRDLITRLRASDVGGSVRVLVGGSALGTTPDLWKALGADGFAATASDAVAVARRLLDH